MRKFNLYVLFIIALFATACSADSTDVASATCDEIDSILATAQDNLVEQEALAESDSNLDRVQADVESAQAELEAAQARAEECDNDSESVVADPPGRVETTVFYDEEECATWELVEVDNGESRWLADGLASIREAETKPQARKAAEEWLTMVRTDRELLTGASSFFLVEREVNPDELFDADGCATSEAETLLAELELALATGDVEPSEAPADATNSGTDTDGNVTVSEHAGITGDRRAVKVTLRDGREVWIMARCGNPVTDTPPEDVPTGPTDEPEQPDEPEEPSSKKDPSKDVLLNEDVPAGVRGPGAGTNETEPDAPISHGVGDADGDGNVEVGDVSPEVWEDVTDDGYCQTACGTDGTSPPEEATPSPAPASPDEEDVAPSDDSPEVGDEGSSGSATTGGGTQTGGSEGNSDHGEDDSQGGEADGSESDDPADDSACDPFEGCG